VLLSQALATVSQRYQTTRPNFERNRLHIRPETSAKKNNKFLRIDLPEFNFSACVLQSLSLLDLLERYQAVLGIVNTS